VVDSSGEFKEAQSRAADSEENQAGPVRTNRQIGRGAFPGITSSLFLPLLLSAKFLDAA
jgi:hypothetical protein